MNYLLNLVTNNALATIKGLQLSNSNYQTALDLLNERYNDPQITISLHMSNLLNLETVKLISDFKGLRAVYDEVKIQVPSLDNLGLQPNHYVPMLIPVLMNKLLKEFKIIISRGYDQNVWNISKVLQIFKC